jgi:ferric-dicitrate binding protein FerR (iron transport regulator)
MEKNNPDLLFRKALHLLNDIKELASINVAETYRQTRLKIKSNRQKLIYSRLMRYAAILMLPFLIASLVLGYLYFHEPALHEAYAKVIAAPGTIIRYELPDRSVVWLNAGSTLRYPAVFRKNKRNVELVGEAYFEVQADYEHPFHVNTTAGLSVYVYGTKFNVSAYEDENYIETVLETGKVNVITPHQETIVLSPGEQLLYDKQNQKIAAPDKVDVYEKVSWKEGKLIFRNATLEDIFKRLARHFNVDIRFNNRQGKEYKYRATFHHETLSQILNYLAKSADLTWKVEEAEQQTKDTFAKTKIIVDLY